VTGSHRSGTTWIGRTICQHDGIMYVHEPFNVDHPNQMMNLKLSKWFTHYSSTNQKDAICSSFDKLLNSNRYHRTVWMAKNTGFKKTITFNIGKHLINNLFRSTLILIKDPIALLSAGWLYENYGLKVICTMRNPLAFVGSLKKANWDFDFSNLRDQKALMESFISPYAKQVETIGKHNSSFIDRACLLWNILHYIIKDYKERYKSWFFIKYENIAVDPITEFQKLFEYIGINMHSTIREYIRDYTSNNNPIESKSNLYQPRNAERSLNTWKQRLNNSEIKTVKHNTSKLYSELF